MANPFLNQKRLQEFYDKTDKQELKTLFRTHILIKPGERLNCQIEPSEKPKKNVFLQSNHEILGKIGSLYQAKNITKIWLNTPENKPRMHSLNIGSFGLNSTKNELGIEYKQNRSQFIEYLKSVKSSALILNLQDVPEDMELFESATSEGFDVYFIPNIFYSLGQFNTRPDCGQALFLNRNLENYNLNLLNLSLSFHHGGFYDYGVSFKKYQSEDLLHKPLTLYFTFQNTVSAEFYLISNAYVAAFSSQKNRFESLKDSVGVLKQMTDLLSSRKRNKELIVRFTGDFNFYGYNTHQGPFGLPAEPFAHLPALFTALTGFRPWRLFKHKQLFKLGSNYYNKSEVEKVKIWLLENNMALSTDAYRQLNDSKTVLLEELAPKPLKKIFNGSGTSWILDLCISPAWSRSFNIWYENEPFGNIDHKTMIVQL